MKKYCRYCTNLVTGNGIYCTVKEHTVSENYAKRSNSCKDFDFNAIDAFGENPRPYKPREPNAITEADGDQISMFKEVIPDDDQ